MSALLRGVLVVVLGVAVAGLASPGEALPQPVLPAASSASAPRAPTKAASIADAWRALPDINGHACGDDDLIFDYAESGGMRNFFCRALTVVSWKTFLALAPSAPFRAGPHKGTKLKLHESRDFGRYDPLFVRWAVDALVPGATDPLLRAQTQASYDSLIRTLARTYWEVRRALDADPEWRTRELKIYLRAAAASATWDADVVSLYHDLLGNADESWGGYDPNHVRSATMWWLRREKDGTAAIWREGLEKLLTAYDGAWLAEHRAPWTRGLPQRPPRPAKPEYE